MHHFFASVLRIRIKNWHAHVRKARKASDAMLQFSTKADQLPAEINAAWDEFRQTPSDATLQKWMSLLALKGTEVEVVSAIRSEAEGLYEVAIRDGGEGKLLAAIAEAEETLKVREEKTRADDEQRTAEAGEPIVSSAVFKKIEEMRDQLFHARENSSNVMLAKQHLESVIGTGD